MGITRTDVSFNLIDTPIDYFKLEEEHFSEKGFVTSIESLKLNPVENYVEKEHLTNLDLNDKETVVFNFQVGKGKTSLFYKLILDYFNLDYYIIVCSPFIKLVKKDLENIIDKFPKTPLSPHLQRILQTSEPTKTGRNKAFYASTESLNELDYKFDEYYYDTAPMRFPIHVMTINTLLGNSGEEMNEQSFIKKKYLRNLLNETEKEKVVIFFDEVHESVHNFKSYLIPNLLRWNNRVEKIFISSATFTPATIPLIKTAALLTEKKIRIYDLPRLKNQILSKIYLHVHSLPYSPKHFLFKTTIDRIVKKNIAQKVPTHIITGTKSMAESLASHCFDEEKIIKNTDSIDSSKSLDYVNLSTADTHVPFLESQNNIGTTFKTGVNITNPKQNLIVVFPTVNREKKYQFYGIFSDGISSIIQAIGRLRNGGDLHLNIYNPDYLIGDESHYPEKFHDIQDEKIFPFEPLNKTYDLVKEKYTKKIDAHMNEIRKMEGAILNTKSNSDKLFLKYKNDFCFWYPNVHEYMLKSQPLLMHGKNPSFGRWLSPYILWACINNQFANAKLEKIYHYDTGKLIIRINKINALKEFKKILNPHQIQIKQQGFRTSLEMLQEFISFELNPVKGKIPIRFKIKDEESKFTTEEEKPLTAAVLTNKEVEITRAAITALYAFTGNTFDFNDKYEYLNKCIEEIAGINKVQANALQKSYIALGELQKEFNKWFSTKELLVNSKSYISKDAYKDVDDDFVEKVKAAMIDLRKNDKVISYKAISFLQNIETNSILQKKRSLYNEFRDLSYTVEKRPTSIQSKIYFEVLTRTSYVPSTNKFL